MELKLGKVYIQDYVVNELSKLYTLDLATGKASLVGEIVTEVSDIAFLGNELYGLDAEGDKTTLIKIDFNTGDAVSIGNIGFATVGLAYNHQRQTLYATTAKQLITIDIKTGKGKPDFTVADKDHNCGEVAFDAEGKAYITLIGYDKKKFLATCNLDTGKVNIIGDIGFPDVASIEFVDGILYGVTGNFFQLGKDGQLIRIDIKTGKGTLIAMTDPIGRWAGMAIYAHKTAGVSVTTSKLKPGKKSENIKVSQVSQVTKSSKKEELMSTLTIDTKTNCYVIDASQMNHLQDQVASAFTFQKGTFEIRITGGQYTYSKTRTTGEPFVLLWIYGDNNTTFINKNTGFEVGATWTTLNGYNDKLTIEVKERTVLNALFFDFSNEDNGGSIDLLITSTKPFFNPVSLTVDSKNNCYLLDEHYLSSISQSGNNLIELNPGNYRIKIREGNASYWSDNKKFDVEPWAIILVKGGKFITKLTGIEVEETWVSLNGFKDEVVLEIKEKTTLTGLFIDTYKEDNEGEIILAIEPVQAAEITERYQQQGTTVINESRTSVTAQNVSSSQSSSQSSSASTQTSVAAFQNSGTSTQFTFRLNEEEFKKKWEEQLQQINASIKVVDKADVALEAKYWDQLEQWLLKNYEKHFKNLSVEVAKVRFSMDAYQQQIEFSLNQHLQGWSSYLERMLEEKINVEISTRVNQQITQYVDQIFEQRVRNVVVNRQEISQIVNQQIDSIFEQNIRNNIGFLTQNIINNNTELNQYVSQQIGQNFEQNIRNNINLLTQSIVNNNTELNQYVDQKIDQSFDQNIQNHIQVITQNIINNNEVFNQYFEQHLEQVVNNNTEVNHNIVNIVANSTEINDKLEHIRNEWKQSFIGLVSERVNELINVFGEREEFNQLITQKITENNTAINEYVSQQIDHTYEQKLHSYVTLITQNIINNNETLNQYVDQRLQTNVTNNNIVIQQIFNNEQMTQKIQNLLVENSQIHQKIENVVINSAEINNKILNFVVNSNEINNKISNVYKDIDVKVDNLRNEWNQSFITLVGQYVDELINIIGDRESFNLRVANMINIKVDELLNQILRIRNELTVIINNSDRHLYEWTLGELMAIKGCLTDRQTLVEQLVTFSSELRTKLDSTVCVDINTFQPFKPLSANPAQFAPMQPPQLPETK
ncbi:MULTISPECIES: hypothetical protein [unclassified Nodularia (in: cyanobacteria)]|uniref:YncE family protein n=1 Tax=unclassified Nodularia (in: cyanobacteria) TaxID=2656917 RepID=UPI00187EEA59|nr:MULTISPECIES: hypothetical protein [unclassified Nodularia (in: cyanobacteria)]MBE9199788.1 hypothetical protein [Nodularia sp. LEGE 06071]MCC2695035.1 hypothetical protein [Nodularia sp. LEGE 04288]